MFRQRRPSQAQTHVHTGVENPVQVEQAAGTNVLETVDSTQTPINSMKYSFGFWVHYE